MAIYLSFDVRGLLDLTDAMKIAKDNGSKEVQAEFDRSILTLKRKSPTEYVTLRIVKGDFTTMYQENSFVVWSIDDETLECAVWRLIECESSREFNPAEFLQVKIPKNKDIDELYGEMIDV